jgi:hypothetical protein
MDSNSKTHQQIDDRGENDLERIIEELTNQTILLEQRVEMQQKQLEYLKQQIRKYSGKKDIQ